MNRLIDLRFVIGAFFTVVGILLLLYGILDAAQADQSVNKWCGGIFIVFGVLMLLLSRQKNVHDEL